MTDPTDPATDPQRLDAAFASGAERYSDWILDPDHDGWLDASARRELGEYSLGEGVMAEAAGLLAEQSLQRLGQELEEFLGALDARPRGDERACALMLALLLVGRRVADAAQIRCGETVFGDQLRPLEHLVIEPDAMVGDFTVNFLLTYSQEGPNPEAHEDPSAPAGVWVTRRLALVRDGRHCGVEPQSILRRQALAQSLDVIAVSYGDDDVLRDPFALATRVVRELKQATSDALYG